MKNILVTTTVLAAMVAGIATAEVEATSMSSGLSVTAGGLADFQVGSRHQKHSYKNNLSPAQKNVRFENYAEAYLKAVGKSDVGFTYGGVVSLATNARNYSGTNEGKFDASYVFVETGLGRLEMGSNEGASSTLKVDAASVARATGGINGDYVDYMQNSFFDPNGAQTAMGPYLTSASFLNEYKFARNEVARKVTYYTPRYSGFQFGLSYTPDQQVGGATLPVNGKASSNLVAQGFTGPYNMKDVFAGGVNYHGQYDQFSFRASLLGEAANKDVAANADTNNNHRLRSWAAGASVDYAGFTVAGSYGESDKKFLFSDAQRVSQATVYKNLKYWTAGAAYVQGPVGVSVTYLDSEYKKNTFKNVVVGADYQLAPGLLPYVEASFFSAKTNPANTSNVTLPKNNGQVYMVGTQVRF